MSERSGSQGEFGRAVPVRLPGLSSCPAGHRLAVAGCGRSWSHYYGLPAVTCDVCLELNLSTARWAEVDPAKQRQAGYAAGAGLELVATPPASRGDVGTIALHLDGHPVGTIHVALCGPCRVGILGRVHVAHEHRRRGYGRTLVAAALARGRDFRWSSITVDDTAVIRAFCAAVSPPGLELGQPAPCSDMSPEREPASA